MDLDLPFRVSTLIFIQNHRNEFLLLKRSKSPNKGNWSPIGGKLEMNKGESPFECAIRESYEEANLKLSSKDLHLFAMISEKGYEGQSHWLLFLFKCLVKIDFLPQDIQEGEFSFFTRNAINDLDLPKTDQECLWPLYDQYHNRFVALKADCYPDKNLQIIFEESF